MSKQEIFDLAVCVHWFLLIDLLTAALIFFQKMKCLRHFVFLVQTNCYFAANIAS